MFKKLFFLLLLFITCNALGQALITHDSTSNIGEFKFYTNATNNLSCTWNFGDGTIDSSYNLTDTVYHTYQNSNEYYFSLNFYAPLVGSQTYYDTIYVNIPNTPCFLTHSVLATTPPFYPFEFTGHNAAPNGMHSFDFGDGSSTPYDSLVSYDHFYTSIGSYIVTFSTINSSGDTCFSFDTVNISYIPPCGFTISDSGNGEFHFMTTIDSNENVFWDFGNGSIGSGYSVTHNYTNEGSYQISMILTSNNDTCISIDSIFVDSLILPLSCNFNATDSGFGTFNFLANTDSLATVSWDYGDGNFGSGFNTFHAYANTGTYFVTMTSVLGNDSCFYTDSVQYTDPNELTCSYTYADSGFGTFNFIANTDSLATVSWNFGDGNFGSGFNAFHTYTNSGTYFVTMTSVLGNDSCFYTDSITYITSNPLACSYTYADSGFGIFNFIANTDSLATVSWDYGDGNFGSGFNAFHTYTNTGTYFVTMTSVLGNDSCFYTDSITYITSNPLACSYTYADSGFGTFNFIANTDSLATVSWDYGDGNFGSGFNAFHTYTNSGTYFVTMTSVLGNDSCFFTDSVNVTINTSSSPQEISHEPTNNIGEFKFYTDVLGNQNCTWDFGNGNIDSTHTAQDTVYETYNSSGQYYVTVSAYVPFVGLKTFYDTVNVNLSNSLTCNYTANDLGGGLFNFNAQTDSLATILWEFGDGNTGNGHYASHSYNSPGTYFIKMTSILGNDSCFYTDSINVTLNNVTCQISHADFGGGQINFDLFPGSTIDSNLNYLWTFGDNDSLATNNDFAEHTYTTSGTYIVTVNFIDSGSIVCSATETINVIIPSTLTCSYTTIDSNNGSFGFIATTDSLATVSWDYGDGNFGSGFNAFHTYTNTGTYFVTMSVFTTNDSCFFTDSVNVTINTSSSPQEISHEPTNNIGEFKFYTDVLGNQNCTWDFGNGNIDSTHTAQDTVYETYNSSGQYYVTVSAYVPFVGLKTFYDTVNVNLSNSLTCNYTANDLGGGLFNFNAQTDSLATILWEFGDGNTGNGHYASHSYNSPGTYFIKMTSILGNDSCFYTDSINVTLNNVTCQISHADFGGGQINFDLFPGSTIDSNLNYLWTFGDNDSLATNNDFAEHTYTTSGTYIVTVNFIDSGSIVCSATETINVIIPSTLTCSYTTIDSNNGSFGFIATTDSLATVSWDYGDGNFGSGFNAFHTYTNTGTYFVTMSVFTTNDSCFFTDSIDYVIPNSSICNFTQIPMGQGTIQFNSFAPSAANFLWEFGDGNSSNIPNPMHKFNSGAYHVTLTSIDTSTLDSCIFYDSVIVNASPDSTCYYSISLLNINRVNVIFSPIGNIELLSSVLWDYGDGGTSTNISENHYYNSPGNYQACLTAITINNDTCTSCKSVVILPSYGNGQIAQFTYFVSNLTTFFIDQSLLGTTSRLWDFGDGNISNFVFPNHTYSAGGIYTVTLVSTNSQGYSDTAVQQVFVYDTTIASNNGNCKASYAFTQDALNNVIIVNTSTSSDPTVNYLWDFGDGNTSTDILPSHTYANTGEYEICLSITSPNINCSSSFCDSVYVDSNGFMGLRNNGFSINVVSPEQLTQGHTTTISNNDNEVNLINSFPNPTNEIVNIVFNSKKNQSIVVNIYDISGALIRSRNNTLDEGENTLKVNLSTLTKGSYFIDISNNNFKSLTRIIKN